MLNSAEEFMEERPLGLSLSDFRVCHWDPGAQEVYLVKIDIFGSEPYFAAGKVDLYLSPMS